MKVSEGQQEAGIVVGNNFDKYGSKNPIVRWIMDGFEGSLDSLLELASPETVHEVGCGEGYWVIDLNKKNINARGSDFSKTVINIAKENADKVGLSGSLFEVKSIYDIEKEVDSADLMVCCEVLEHLEQPELALEALKAAASKYVILSVPREPIWCALNLVRGKYISSLGNTPGHIQHWSSKSFINLVSDYFEIIEVKKPLPWTMLLCKVRS